jgi:UDP-GlcNAc:undecaprenyl-phosphate GlcNAc-1-phosphate transferase
MGCVTVLGSERAVRAYVFAFVLAAVTSALLTPLARILALKMGAVSNPGGRNVNERTVPRLGGLAIAVGFVVPLVVLVSTESAAAVALRQSAYRFAGLLACAMGLSAVGALDDTRRLRASHKLVAQVAAASIAYAVGFRIDAIKLPVAGVISMGAFGLPVTVLWIVAIVNAVNLIDGLDGLAAGVAFFAGVTNFVVGYVSRDIFVDTTMATLLGAVIGFLFFNFNPARIFMGDSGSYLLGFILGATSASGSSQKASTAVSILVPMLALGLPLFDTLFALVRRYLERRPMFSPDRGHVHHRLLDMGLTHRRAVLTLYGVSLAFTAAAIGVYLGRSWQVGVALLSATAILVGLVRFVGYYEYVFLVRRQRGRLRSPEEQSLRRLIPRVPGAFAAATNEEEVFSTLAGLLAPAGLARVELLSMGDRVELRAWDGVSAPATDGLVSAKYPIGEDRLARAQLCFRWASTTGEVTASTEILLQIIVDVAAGALLRVRSGFAPVPPEDRALPESAGTAALGFET